MFFGHVGTPLTFRACWARGHESYDCKALLAFNWCLGGQLDYIDKLFRRHNSSSAFHRALLPGVVDACVLLSAAVAGCLALLRSPTSIFRTIVWLPNAGDWTTIAVT